MKFVKSCDSFTNLFFNPPFYQYTYVLVRKKGYCGGNNITEGVLSE